MSLAVLHIAFPVLLDILNISLSYTVLEQYPLAQK
jgi:hypothetical protein